MISLHREFNEHKLAYLSLAIGLAGLALLYMAVWPSYFWQRVVSLLIAVFYAFWGISTHLRTKKINKFVVYEYISVASLGALLLLLVTL